MKKIWSHKKLLLKDNVPYVRFGFLAFKVVTSNATLFKKEAEPIYPVNKCV